VFSNPRFKGTSVLNFFFFQGWGRPESWKKSCTLLSTNGFFFDGLQNASWLKSAHERMNLSFKQSDLEKQTN